jgi:hypothetical protein
MKDAHVRCQLIRIPTRWMAFSLVERHTLLVVWDT